MPVLIHSLDLFGTMAFAVTGAMKGVAFKMDILGVIVLSSITGMAGGMLRDIVLGRTPPAALIDPTYILVTTITGISVFYLYPNIKSLLGLFLKFDALGLGVFSIIGATIALNSGYGLNLLIMMFAGVITAVGGGIVRDVLVNEKPLVFIKELYVSLSFIGILLFFSLLYIGVALDTSSIIGISFITGLRIAAMRFNWNLPRRKANDL
jgi:uncharacterized membrane protein YeiH